MDAISTLLNDTKTSSSKAGSLYADRGRDDSFERMLEKARENDKIREKVLRNRKLANRATLNGPLSFKKGVGGASEVAEGLELARAGLPSSYKKQVGLGLVAMGQTGSSADSMAAGAGLMGCHSSAEALKGILNSLGAERGVMKLDKSALPALGQVLADSGLDDESINKFLSDLAKGDMTLDRIFFGLSQLNFPTGATGGLTATADGLPALGQFFGSLGASTDIMGKVTSGFQPGDKVTAAALRQIIGSGDDGLLASTLSEADARNLASMLKSMGATDDQLNGLSTLLAKTQGQMSMDDFLGFIEGMETTPTKTVTGKELEMVKAIMENISREQELVKTPVFNEVLTKIQALGDRDIDDNFTKLSPALQALRGGVSAMSQNASPGGHPGQGGLGGQNAQHQDHESKEHYRQMLHQAQGAEPTPAAAIEAAETFAGYGGQESLARQISQKMVYSHRRGLHRLKMNLNPVDMGRLDIELKVKGGELVAHIRAENREAYEALANEIDDLKQALADGGLSIGNLTLSYDDQATGNREFADLGMAEARARKAGRIQETGPAASDGAAAHQGELYRVV